jgi:imidazolonepropionase-like amidohydrolase
MASSLFYMAPVAALSLFTAVAPTAKPAPGDTASSNATVAIQAGTIHLVENGTVLEGGATILVRGGKIVAVGKDVEVPAGSRVIDYGADAVIVPGLVAADSNYGAPRPSERTADPFIRAIDNFDPYASFVFALQEGVTTAYFAPARGRLIAGQGAVVKLSGGPDADRVLSDCAVIHGSIGEDARNTPGYWQPPVPATIDTGMGVEQQQLPKSLMGAIVALDELMAIAKGGPDKGEYGPGVGAKLRELMEAKKPWRIGANSEPEIRAALDFFKKSGQPLILDGANGAAPLAKEIAKSGVSVILEAPYTPNQGGRDFGKGRDAEWPRYDAAVALAKAGVKFAIAPSAMMSASDLRFAAALMSRGGLDPETALRAITLSPAEILGVADRVGSISVGKDADIAVFSGSPVAAGSDLIAVWAEGEASFKPYETGSVVVHVDELHLGDGEILSPGEILMEKGKIVDVGRSVGRPSGAVVVKGGAAMPGMIDALGHLGLEGSSRVPATRFEMKRIVEPGDLADRRVAKSGVTTVALSPRGVSRSGAPMMAYKPAGDDVEKMVIADPCALRLQWTERNRRDSGKAVRETLQKSVEYAKKWAEYQDKLSKWTPPPAGASAEKKEGEAKKEGDADKKDADAKKDGEGDKKEDKKKKKGEEEPAKPITGAWETKVTVPPFSETRLRLYLNDEDGKISGSLRCDTLSSTLVQVTGARDKHKVTLSGEGSNGQVTLEGETAENKLKGKITLGETKIDFEATQTSTEYEIVRRSEVRKPKEEKKPEIKGEPRSPGVDPDLEPFRKAMMGTGAIIVGVDREDEILDCVDAFNDAGIRPVLFGANDAYKVVDKLRGHVAGILLSQRVIYTEPKTGAQKRNRYAEIAAAGISIAFHSDAEEGAADLPLIAAYAVSQGMSPTAALRALTMDAAKMLAIDSRVGAIAPGLDADVVMFDRSPLDASASVVRVWVNGKEVR